MGAGGGGFFLLFVQPSKQRNVRERLYTVIQGPFKLDWVYCEHSADPRVPIQSKLRPYS